MNNSYELQNDFSKSVANDSLTERQRKETEWQDKKTIEGTHCYHGDGQSEYYKHFGRMIGDVNGLNVLDLGCGDGWFGIELAKRGAKVWGVDISGELLREATKQVVLNELDESIRLVRMSAEHLAFRSNIFDMVIGSAILHHTDLTITAKGIHQVLKPSGRAVFIEPLNENILLKIWRKLTPWRRSPVEKALDFSDLLVIEKNFKSTQRDFFVFSSLFTEGLLILFPTSRTLKILDNFFSRIDTYLLKRIPRLGKCCAVVVLNLIK
jgi:ubiquinone/menaquinone biosynthesis C-methylase UbiE